ncbi:MAG: hypothetical protein JRI25_13290 [Deltaproteobacteria bacterium]|nr:hypothetical protein [Deltaproteobacteria bacterium]
MTREELDAFLTRVGASSLNEYLGVSPGENPVVALDEKMRWAAWHFSDRDQGPEAEFVMTYASQIRSILDEGESTWRNRTAHGNVKMREAIQNRRNRERQERDSWSALPAFLTPPVAPPRDVRKAEESRDEGASTPPEPEKALSEEERVNLLRAKLEAIPFPGEDSTDPIGFHAFTLPEGARAESAYTPPGRVRRGVGPEVFEVPPDPGVATGAHAFVDWERLGQSSDVLPTDPGIAEPGPFLPDEHSDEITRWLPTAFIVTIGTALLILAVAALGIAMFELGRRHGATELRRDVPTSTVIPAEH